MPVQIGSRASDFSDPTGLMSDCHRRIEMFLNTLRAAGDLNGRQLAEDEQRALDAALRYFREAALKPNADEEESLFSRLRQPAASSSCTAQIQSSSPVSSGSSAATLPLLAVQRGELNQTLPSYRP